MNNISRRQFGKTAAAAAALAGVTLPEIVAWPAPAETRQFPQGFVWGCATAAYQIEGAVNEGGREAIDLGCVFAHAGQDPQRRYRRRGRRFLSPVQGGHAAPQKPRRGRVPIVDFLAAHLSRRHGPAESRGAWTTTSAWWTSCLRMVLRLTSRSFTGTCRRPCLADGSRAIRQWHLRSTRVMWRASSPTACITS